MRIGVGVKFGFWLSLLGLAAIGATGFYAYSAVEAMLVASAKQRLVTATTVLGRRFSVALNEVARDVGLLARLEEVEGLQHTGGDDEAMRRRLADIFAATLDLHPEYLQLRLIGARAFGRELVRVDRTSEGTARIEGAELQEKGHFPYVYRTLAQPPGTYYVSAINLNRERGVRFGLDEPTVRLALPVHAAAGEVFGLMIVNVALNGLFTQLRADLPRGMELYLANSEGDYLIHPDPAMSFGFDRGRRQRIQDDFEAALPVLERRIQSVVLEAGGRVSAFVDVPFGPTAPERRALLGLAIPRALALQGLDVFAERLLLIVLGFGLLAVLASFVLSRLLVRPLDRVVSGLNRFSRGLPLEALPTSRRDEIGLLARSFEDMAGQIRAQLETLRLNEKSLNRILEAAPSGMLIAARDDHRLLFRNTVARKRFPDTDAEHAFHPIDDGLGPEEAQLLYSELQRVGQVEYAEHRLRTANGDEYWALLSMVGIDYRGRAAILISIVDITRRKEAELELERYRNELEVRVEARTAELVVAQRDALRNERLAAIGQLTGTVSHELRNPLGTIHTSFALLRELIDENDPRIARAAARIDRSVSRCDRIIEELLDYTRVRDPALEATDLDAWLEELLDEQVLAEEIRIERSLASAATIPVDRHRLAQALVNLVQNACQAMSEADPPAAPPVLRIRSRALAGRVELEVEDTGPGIGEADVARIFEPLFSTRPFGIGLGLPLVKQVMELHEGGVEVDSVPGQGTRVTLWLPRRGARPTVAGAAATAGPRD